MIIITTCFYGMSGLQKCTVLLYYLTLTTRLLLLLFFYCTHHLFCILLSCFVFFSSGDDTLRLCEIQRCGLQRGPAELLLGSVLSELDQHHQRL